MRKSYRPLRAALFAFLFAVLMIQGCTSNKIIRTMDKSDIGFERLIGELMTSDVVFVGELHDEEWNHRMQLDIIKGLRKAGAELAIGMEMFRSEHQPALDAWVAGEMGEDDFTKVYYTDWHIPWSNYRDILIYARDERIPVVGLNVARSVIHKVFTKGFDELTPEEKALLPGVVTCDVDKEYEDFIREAMGEHSNEGTFKNFCEAQMVWDMSMAQRIIEYAEENPGRLLVVLAGSGHSWRRGIPTQVSKRASIPYRIVLPETAMYFREHEVTVGDADYLWIEDSLDSYFAFE